MTPEEIADLLESSGQAFANLLKTLPPAVASWRPAPDEWCVNECVGHIIEAEKRGFAGRIRIIVAEDEPQLENWKQVDISRARHDCDRTSRQMLEEFEPMRRESIALVRSLKPEQLKRGGMHPKVARLTVVELLHEWVHHDGNHLRQAYSNVQAYVWPDMGNAQRFSG
ncbi:MAG: DinB family protein [Chloroflexi bacterium]|nr:MAG: DinB family protein [Chloroflexota bacterium]TME41993.1 MAG: DinB family protein [Chloroflexota bacterium]TME50927.1 MAG: DinB family protein [Chloroflexota bacterium]